MGGRAPPRADRARMRTPFAPPIADCPAGNARCVWLSTKPGITTRPAALISMASRAEARFSRRRVVPTSIDAVADQYRAIGDDPEFVECAAAPRPRAAQCEQLARAPNQNGARFS